MYELYIGNKNYSSWSLRPWVLMSELGIVFAEHVVAFDPGTSWTKFRAFSPSGKVPCLVDGSTVVWDSLGITEYLAERHAGVWPGEAAARAWARCAAAEMHSGFGALRNTCAMNCGLRVRLHEVTAGAAARPRSDRRVVVGGSAAVRRPVPRRRAVQRSGCLFLLRWRSAC